MKEKKVKVKKTKEKVSLKERIGSLFFTVIALLVAVVVFIGFMFLRSYFADEITYKDVFVVKTEIPEDEIITEENITNYFGTKKINAEDATQGAYTPNDYEKLYGKKARVTLHVGEEVSESDFADVNVYLDYIEDPVQLSIATGDIAGTNGGKIRAGDIVNITLMFTAEQLGMVDEDGNAVDDYQDTPNGVEGDAADWYGQSNLVDNEDKEEIGTLTAVDKMEDGYNFNLYARYMLENIYIQKVLTVDGVEIAPTDKDSAAGIIVLVVPKKIELELNNILVNCQSMRISKVLYEISPEDLYKDTSLKEEVTPELVDLEETTEEEVVVLPEEGWTEVDENGLSYLVFDNPGVSHYVKDASGITYEEECTFEEVLENTSESSEDVATCIHCLAEKPTVEDSVEGSEEDIAEDSNVEESTTEESVESVENASATN